MAEKTEKATPKKLRDARKKGQVAKSQDFPSAFTFVTSLLGTIVAGSYFMKNLVSFLIDMLKSVRSANEIGHQVGGFFYVALQVILMTSFPLVVVVATVGVITNFLIVGPVFSFEAMKFNWKKLNPVEGIKQKFKLKTLVELIKSILKILGAAIIIFFVIKSMIPQAIATAGMPLEGMASVLSDFLIKVAIRIGIFFLIVAIFDLAFQKRTFKKEMMMEKFEVKQELKDTEGDPMIKGKRREISREIAYREGPSAAARAKAIITNPTHIAVAIGFNEEEEVAPVILTMGEGPVAEKIIKIAIDNNVAVMRNPELARDLYTRCEVSDYIPVDTYEAIAEILKWVDSLQESPDANMELFQ